MEYQAQPNPRRNYNALPHTILVRLCDYIEAHLESPLTLEELGGVVQYSPFHLARRFRQATGQTLHQYVTSRRLAKAQALLATTDLPLQQVAAQAGFSDQSHLSNAFRKAYGCAPSAVRKNLQIARTDFQDVSANSRYL
jgi:AraC family transcriptional regulator